MQYTSILDPIPWMAAGISAIQAVIIYWLIIIVIRIIGIHAVGQTGPQYLVFLLLLTTSMSNGLNDQRAGFWGSIISGIVLFLTVLIVQRIPKLGQWIHGKPVLLMENSEIDHNAMKRTLVGFGELEKVAHEYGMPSHKVFDSVILENDGRLTAILKPEFRESEATKSVKSKR